MKKGFLLAVIMCLASLAYSDEALQQPERSPQELREPIDITGTWVVYDPDKAPYTIGFKTDGTYYLQYANAFIIDSDYTVEMNLLVTDAFDPFDGEVTEYALEKMEDDPVTYNLLSERKEITIVQVGNNPDADLFIGTWIDVDWWGENRERGDWEFTFSSSGLVIYESRNRTKTGVFTVSEEQLIITWENDEEQDIWEINQFWPTEFIYMGRGDGRTSGTRSYSLLLLERN